MSVIMCRPAAAFAPQVSRAGNAALVEREAITMPLNHAFGFQLADVGPAAIEALRYSRSSRSGRQKRDHDRAGRMGSSEA